MRANPVLRRHGLSVLLALAAVAAPFAALVGKHPGLAVSGLPLALVAGLLGRRAPNN
jgi:hypothetical protein